MIRGSFKASLITQLNVFHSLNMHMERMRVTKTNSFKTRLITQLARLIFLNILYAYFKISCEPMYCSWTFFIRSTCSTHNNLFLLDRQVWNWCWPMHLLFGQGSISLEKLPNEWMNYHSSNKMFQTHNLQYLFRFTHATKCFNVQLTSPTKCFNAQLAIFGLVDWSNEMIQPLSWRSN